nr:venom acid phosphatase Acph-1-like [Leptinotarsa decemlineata]
MKFLTLLSFFLIILELNCEDSLVFVHVIFRHGNRTPEQNNLYQASPYMNETYFKPYGFGQLTNKGKLNAYNVGKSLRQRYSGFLDEEYNIKLIDARSSDFNRTKASLQAMLAGLFPPSKDLIWLEGLNWQPIPYTYVDRSLDKELFCFGCSNWDKNFDGYLHGSNGKPLIDSYRKTFDYLTEKTGENYNDLVKTYYLYFGLEILEELKYALPEWASEVYPYPMKNITTLHYNVMVATKTLRQMAAGYLLKKILSDTQEKIDGKFPDKKMSVWCGHENNIAALLKILKVWNEEEIASYGSNILMELHFIDQKYGFKIYFSNKQSNPDLLSIPGCGNFCPLDEFNVLVRNEIPTSDEICGKASPANSLIVNNWIIIWFSSIVCYKIIF